MVISSEKDDFKDKSDKYIPRGSCDSDSRIVAILSKLVKGKECQKSFLKNIKSVLSRMTQKTIKQLEKQYGQMLGTVN